MFTLPRRIVSLIAVIFFSGSARLPAAPVHLVDEAPVAITQVAPGVVLVDFGRVAFGNVRLMPPAGANGGITVHFGEAFSGGRILRTPPGTVRYASTTVTLRGTAPVVAAPAPDARNTRQIAPDEKPDAFGYIAPPAVLTPAAWGVVLPFRWVEIEGWNGELRHEHLRRQAAFATTWDDSAAAFHSSDERLNRIWELCRYSIKATTFAGVYVDGDRERIPYEADAYLNQISHYATDHDVQMARDTFDHLMAHATWPTEWAAHMIFMAHADWMHTGDTAWLAARYESLKSKLLLERTRADGLLTSTPAQIKQGDLVDWPRDERDGYVFTSVNTVVNAFYLRSLTLMAELARALHKDAEAAAYTERERTTRAAFQDKLFDAARGVYRDGEGTDHASQHANLFPLAFGLVPAGERPRVTEFVKSRGMACSVYAAQYLLEALFENDPVAALALITAPGDRSWLHMVNSGTTITWEAWDQRYKPNQDWNHAWGAAPANLFPRYVLGVSPMQPGWSQARIRPFAGGQPDWCKGKIPTPRGPITIDWKRDEGFELNFSLPAGVAAQVEIPASANAEIVVNGKVTSAKRIGDYWQVAELLTGTNRISAREGR